MWECPNFPWRHVCWMCSILKLVGHFLGSLVLVYIPNHVIIVPVYKRECPYSRGRDPPALPSRVENEARFGFSSPAAVCQALPSYLKWRVPPNGNLTQAAFFLVFFLFLTSGNMHGDFYQWLKIVNVQNWIFLNVFSVVFGNLWTCVRACVPDAWKSLLCCERDPPENTELPVNSWCVNISTGAIYFS